MEKELEKQIDNLIKEYGIWKRQLKKDIETYDDETTQEEIGELNAIKIVIQDLKKLKQRNKRG